MTTTTDIRHQESVVLTRGVERIFRKLIRFLIGRMSLVKMQEIIKYVYIEETEVKLKKESPDKNIPLSQIALLSGLDTRTLTKIRNDRKFHQPLHKESEFLDEITPGASILDTWASKSPYVSSASGLPKPLKISGTAESFESLFKESTKSRGITYKSLLKRLIQSGAVSYDDQTELLTLVTNSYLPKDSDDYLGAIEMGFSALGNLIDTISYNLNSIESGKDRYYQRGAWTYRMSDEKAQALRKELNTLLSKTDADAREIIGRLEDKFESTKQFTAGVSLFYFQEIQ